MIKRVCDICGSDNDVCNASFSTGLVVVTGDFCALCKPYVEGVLATCSGQAKDMIKRLRDGTFE
jgi:hypothetical protein